MPKRTIKPDFQRFELRFGLATRWGSAGFPRGIRKQGDPSRIPQDQFWNLQNVRILANQVVSRGGSEKVNDIAESGCITGIFDSGD